MTKPSNTAGTQKQQTNNETENYVVEINKYLGYDNY